MRCSPSFPALSALIALYGLTADPATVERQFAMLASVLPPQAYDIVIQQIRHLAESSNSSLGWGFVLSIGLALWSVSNLTQAMFAALNIAYEEPERRQPAALLSERLSPSPCLAS